jgi:MFS family permease
VFEVLPYLCFGLFAGALADRVNRKRLMVTCDLTNMLLLGSMPVAGVLNILTIPQIYLVGLLSAVAFVWFDAANFGALPALVGREHIVTANSYLSATDSFLFIIGPSLAGLLAALFSPALAISFDALSYACSAVSLLLITRAFNTARSQEAGQDSLLRTTFKDIRDGLQFLVHQPLVRTMTLLGFGNSFTGGAVLSLLVVYGVRVLGLAKNDTRIGLLFTASALGSLLASLLLPRLVKRFSVGRITLITLGLTPLLLFGVANAPNLLIGLLLLGLWDVCYTLTVINGISLRQMVTPDHLQSRVNATARMIAWGGTPFGAAAGGFLAERTTISTTYMIMALGVGISALVGWFSPLREIKAPESATSS